MSRLYYTPFRFVLQALIVAMPSAAEVTLRHGDWTVRIDAATLAVEAARSTSRWTISDAALPSSEVAELKASAAEARWSLPQHKLAAAASLGNEGLRIELQRRGPTQIEWPVLADMRNAEAVILPLAEGLYAPMNEPRWRTFLVEQSPLAMMQQLSMPMWGLRYREGTVTYIAENPFDNELQWEQSRESLGMRLRHRVPRNQPERAHRMLIRIGGDSPVESARHFREWFQSRYGLRTLRQKAQDLPEVERLFGAAHIYLWAAASLTANDVKDWRGFVRALAGSKILSALPADAQKEVRAAASTPHVSAWQKRTILGALDRTPTGNEFEAYFVPSAQRGAAISHKMLDTLRSAGFDRLWLGAPGDEIDMARRNPSVVEHARKLGYLFAPYDSYHSIHSPTERDTWPTAQFDRKLFDTGGIVKEDGVMSKGFQGKGYYLSPLAAEPYVSKRVNAMLRDAPFNSWFIDCDATGELFDNYSRHYPHTQAQDMQLRQQRMEWLAKEKRLVTGSEGGAWFAANAIHFAHGMMTPLFGWQDPLLRDPKSKHFVGKWAPPEEPAVFFQPVELPAKYMDLYFDPRYRLPLYQTAFHDTVITTNHWLLATRKLTNATAVRELLEVLYGVPPLYHLNQESAARMVPEIQPHYRFFSPLHREIATLPMTAFEWLTADRLLQRTEFGGRVEIVANFSSGAQTHGGASIPPRSLRVRRNGSKQADVYTPR
ncbi:MAG: hypothetical protein JNL98_06235 [Bryobacterales bacterium]|nr:hypothetical protein [Bryobacterales bacterium]